MKFKQIAMLLAAVMAAAPLTSQSKLSVHWEELTAADFASAIHHSQGVCLLPFGILEKHGPQLPLGTDLINARYVSEKAAQQDYAVVFPAYYFGQIAEARQQPGTISYSMNLQLRLLQETTDEMARNGCSKIVIVNGHGGNQYLLPYFAQMQLQRQHDYVVYTFVDGGANGPVPGRPALHSADDHHAGEAESSDTLISRPDLVHLERAGQESSKDQARLHLAPGMFTGISWYARFPNHYGGDASKANRPLGQFDMDFWTSGVVAAIRSAKADDESLKLQQEFYKEALHPLDTQQGKAQPRQ